MAQDFTLGRAGLATAAGGDSLELFCDMFEVEGDEIKCGGKIKGDSSSDLRALVAQVQGYGLALYPRGCAGQMWRWDGPFMADAANQAAFRAIGDSLAKLPRKGCVRT